MYRRTALKASLLAFCKNDESLAAVRSYRWSSSDDPLAVGRGRVPLIYNKCLALPGTYLVEKLKFALKLDADSGHSVCCGCRHVGFYDSIDFAFTELNADRCNIRDWYWETYRDSCTKS